VATTASSTDGHVPQLKLAATDPRVRPTSSDDRFSVQFTMEGMDLLELENVLRPRLGAVGVQRISRFGMTISLHGVEEGRESEVFHELQAAIDDVNTARAASREDRERRRSETEAAATVSQDRADKVRKAFRAAQADRRP
jgi:hypothetical protein